MSSSGPAGPAGYAVADNSQSFYLPQETNAIEPQLRLSPDLEAEINRSDYSPRPNYDPNNQTAPLHPASSSTSGHDNKMNTVYASHSSSGYPSLAPLSGGGPFIPQDNQNLNNVNLLKHGNHGNNERVETEVQVMNVEDKVLGCPRNTLINGLHLICQLLCIIAPLVCFGSHLSLIETQSVYSSSYSRRYFFWDHVEIGGEADYSPEFLPECHSGGKGMVAMGIFSLFSLIAGLFLSLARVLGQAVRVPFIGTNLNKYLNWEFSLSVATFFFLIFATASWGVCYSYLRDSYIPTLTVYSSGLRATGFGYLCFSIFVMLCSVILMFLIRRREKNLSIGSQFFSSSQQPSELATSNFR